MPDIPCGKCGSVNLRKNSTAAAGARKYHCKACDFYGTPVTQEEKQRKKEESAEKFLCGRVPQCGIAREVRVSRDRVISHIKKKKSRLPDRRNIRYGSVLR